jgi:hypothetical protein
MPMKLRPIVLVVLLAIGAETVAQAAPPTDLGDSFLTVNFEFRGMGNATTFYLGTDGSCRQLSTVTLNGAGAVPTYGGSVSSTYSYAFTPGNPNEAMLVLSTGASYVLDFTNDTNGAVNGIGSFYMVRPLANSFLANVSNRVALRASEVAVTGFVVGGDAARLVLIRVVGPTLTQFGVSPVSPNPELNLFSGVGTLEIGAGQKWSATTKYDAQAMGWIFSMAGAFPLQAGSNDVVYFGALSPGAYTVQASDSTLGSTGGSALTEVYILPYASAIGPIFGF